MSRVVAFGRQVDFDLLVLCFFGRGGVEFVPCPVGHLWQRPRRLLLEVVLHHRGGLG